MERKIRVLHVAEASGGGGVERYLETLLKYSKGKVENILVCSQNYDYEKFKVLADRVIRLKMEHNIKPSSDIKVERTLRRIIKQIKPDIVYAHSSKAGAFARIADLGLNNKVIYNPHGWAFNTQPSIKKRKVYKWAEKFLANLCDKIICISDAEKESALKENICRLNKLEVIYNGVDLEEIEKSIPVTRQKCNIPEDAFVIGTVARLTELKSPDVFVKAAKIIKKEIPTAYFLMVGDGELKDEILKEIHNSQLDSSFLITGWVENPTAYIKIMNIGMLLSRWWEGFGLVLPEYMACGVPIVATGVGAIPNIVKNGKNGLLVNPDDPQGVANLVNKIYKDKDLKDKLIKNAKKDVQIKFNSQRTAYDTYNLFKDLVC